MSALDIANLFAKAPKAVLKASDSPPYQDLGQDREDPELMRAWQLVVASNAEGANQCFRKFLLRPMIAPQQKAKVGIEAGDAFLRLARDKHYTEGPHAYQQCLLKAKRFYVDALSVYEQLGRRKGAKYCLKNLREIARQQRLVAEEIEYSARLYDWSQGSLDSEAKRVEQGELGFSLDGSRIGTDNLQQCIAVIVEDKSRGTPIIGLAHFDRTKTPDSLYALFKEMSKGTPLRVTLIGASICNRAFVREILDKSRPIAAMISELERLLHPSHPHYAQIKHDTDSLRNLVTVIQGLQSMMMHGYQLGYRNGAIIDPASPDVRATAIVVNPLTGIITNKVPMRGSQKDRFLRAGLLSHPQDEKQFRLAFIHPNPGDMKICLGAKEIASINSRTYSYGPLSRESISVAIKYRLDNERKAPSSQPEWEAAQKILPETELFMSLHEAYLGIRKVFPCDKRDFLEIYVGEGAFEDNIASARAGRLFRSTAQNQNFVARGEMARILPFREADLKEQKLHVGKNALEGNVRLARENKLFNSEANNRILVERYDARIEIAQVLPFQEADLKVDHQELKLKEQKLYVGQGALQRNIELAERRDLFKEADKNHMLVGRYKMFLEIKAIYPCELSDINFDKICWAGEDALDGNVDLAEREELFKEADKNRVFVERYKQQNQSGQLLDEKQGVKRRRLNEEGGASAPILATDLRSRGGAAAYWDGVSARSTRHGAPGAGVAMENQPGPGGRGGATSSRGRSFRLGGRGGGGE